MTYINLCKSQHYQKIKRNMGKKTYRQNIKTPLGNTVTLTATTDGKGNWNYSRQVEVEMVIEPVEHVNVRVFKSYEDFLAREDKTLNGVSAEYAQTFNSLRSFHDSVIKGNKTNVGCWNCTHCRYCLDCVNCTLCKNSERLDSCIKCSNSEDLTFASDMVENTQAISTRNVYVI